MTGRLISVNAGRSRTLASGGRTLITAIDKRPQDAPVAVDAEGLVPDEQVDRRYHGGPEQALYAYASEDYDWWVAQLGRRLQPGLFGENLMTEGLDVSGAVIGEQWRVGDITVAVTGPREPCATFAARMGEPGWVRRFAAAARPGAYLRVLTCGTVRAGEAITVVDRPGHGITVADAFRIRLRQGDQAARLVGVPGLLSPLDAWARNRVARTSEAG